MEQYSWKHGVGSSSQLRECDQKPSLLQKCYWSWLTQACEEERAHHHQKMIVGEERWIVLRNRRVSPCETNEERRACLWLWHDFWTASLPRACGLLNESEWVYGAVPTADDQDKAVGGGGEDPVKAESGGRVRRVTPNRGKHGLVWNLWETEGTSVHC